MRRIEKLKDKKKKSQVESNLNSDLQVSRTSLTFMRFRVKRYQRLPT